MKNITTLILFTVFALTGTARSIAAPAALPQTIDIPALGATSWFVTNDGGTEPGTAFSGVCNQTPGLAIKDATSADASTRAYDYAHTIWVNDFIFAAPATVDLTGTTITAGPVAMFGLQVSMEYAFSEAVQAARIRAIFENPTNIPIDVSVDMPVNSGAIPVTVEATSSGDAVLDVDDRWVVSSDGFANNPVNTTVLWGQRAAVPPSAVTQTVFDCIGNEGVGVSFDISIPANSTRQLLFFAGLGDIEGTGNTIAGAIVNAAMFNAYTNIDPSLLAGIADSELIEILNWDIRPLGTGGGGGTCSLGPTTASAWQAGDLWLLLACICCLGLWQARRRVARQTAACPSRVSESGQGGRTSRLAD